MAKRTPTKFSEDQITLGATLEQLRLKKAISRKELGRSVKVTEQQIALYESGGFVPITMLERIAETLGEPIEKKVIRRISALRHKIIGKAEGHEELGALYATLFEE